MAQIPLEVDAALETIRDGSFVRFAQVAAGTLFAHDVLLNLDVEFKYIWAALNPRKRPIEIVPVVFSIIYLIQRYLPLWDRIILDTYYILGPSDTKSCVTTFKMSAWSTFIGIHLSEYILIMRIWAVWMNKRSVLVALVVLALSTSIPSFLFFVSFLRGLQCPDLHMSSTVQLRGCFCSTKNKDLYLCWIMLMAFNTASFILMAIPGFKTYRRGGKSNLVRIVYQDGIMYYVSLFMVSLTNIVVILQLPSSFIIMISAIERVLRSIIASHVVLQLRKEASRVYGDGTMTTEEFTTEIRFATSALRSNTTELEN